MWKLAIVWLAPTPFMWMFAQAVPTATGDPMTTVLTGLVGSSPVAAVFFWRLWVADKEKERMWALLERSAGLSSVVLSEAKDVRRQVSRGRDLTNRQLLEEFTRLVEASDDGTTE